MGLIKGKYGHQVDGAGAEVSSAATTSTPPPQETEGTGRRHKAGILYIGSR